jgi:transcriptional regulator with GAF, ATPase, and Fis domain
MNAPPLLPWLKGGFDRLYTRQGILTCAGAIVLSYAVAVLLYVRFTPDIGLKTAFSPTIKAIPRDVLRDSASPHPRPGDLVVKAGDVPILMWPDLLQAPRKLQEKLAHLPAQAYPSWAKIVDEDGRQGIWIQVQVERPPGEGQTPQHFGFWCNLGPPNLEEMAPSLLWFMLKLALFTVGILVLWKRPTDRAASQFFLLCLVTLGAYMGGYHWPHIATAPVLLVGFMVFGTLLPAVSLHFYLVFPRPKQVLKDHPRLALGAAYGLPLLVLVGMLALYFRVRWLYHHQFSAEVVDAASRNLLQVIYLSMGVSAVWYLASALALVHSFRTVTDLTERNQVKWILGGTALSLVPIGYSLYLAIWEPDKFGAGAATWPMFAASACVTVAFIVSITRYRLMELDQIVSAGVVYFVLAGLVYYALIFVGTLLFNQVMSGPRLSEALRVSTTALVLLLVLDLARSRLRKALDRRFSREKHHLDRTLERLGEAVQQLVDPPTLLQRLLEGSGELLGAVEGAAYLRQGEPPVYRLASQLGLGQPAPELPAEGPLPEALRAGTGVTARLRYGLPPGPAQLQLRTLGGEVAFPLIHEGRLLAVLVLGHRERAPYRQEDLNLLAAFTRLTALALASAEGHQTIDDLRQELQTKVEKIAEQQRRILALQGQLRRQWAVGSGQWTGGKGTPGRTGRGRPIPAETNGEGTPPVTNSPPPTAHCPLPEHGIVGSGLRVRQVLDMVRKVAATDAVVLIRGESGTGKELLAQAVHQASARAGKALVKVHCAALSPTLLESEMFGHVKGAFTGAINNKTGRFELANGGTLFLDEIGDVSLDLQTKLLRVLQEKTIERVGSGEPVKVDVRILAATHQDLEALIRQGRFREDLFYRLNVFPILLPPLRERPEDIPELALCFLQRCAARCKKEILQIDDDALAVLKGFSWPGNIRQLENVIERAVVIAEGSVITVRELPAELCQAVEPAPSAEWTEDADLVNPDGAVFDRAEREQRERELILRALQSTGGNKAEAARSLGLARSTLVSRLKKYGLA